MTTTADFLFEIQCEELPPKALNNLRLALEESVEQQLVQLQLNYEHIKSFATPRRLALLISALQTQQADQTMQKRGPAVTQAYDTTGNPSKACLGFLKSCNADIKELKTVKTDQGEWVYCDQHIPGKKTAELLPDILNQAIKALPVPKWMRWGNHEVQFARPAHHIVLMCNDQVIDTTILGLKTSNITVGHRFIGQHTPSFPRKREPSEQTLDSRLHGNSETPVVIIKHARDYEQTLLDNFVIADFDARKKEINKQIRTMESIYVVGSDDLLEEVTAIVEWPTALLAHFDKTFLTVPHEALIAAIQDHQKSFPVRSSENDDQLSNKFIFISNIAPNDFNVTIKGNEKVMTARLSDAQFFYETDLKIPLATLVEKLKTVTFQKQLGSLYDKAKRLEILCEYIHCFGHPNCESPNAKRAGLLAKADLLTNMVCEFTELQGIMGYYYAKHDGENKEVALALKEQYLPRFVGDARPSSRLGQALSIADKIDNLVGNFGINQMPTSSKDPFGLRRAAFGIIDIILENKLSLDLKKLIDFAISTFQIDLPNKNLRTDLFEFLKDRFDPPMKLAEFKFDEINAVLSLNLGDFYDCYERIKAVAAFKKFPEAESLAAANKRVANILQKNTELLNQQVNDKLFEKSAETTLYHAILAQEKNSQAATNYTETLTQLAALRPAIDTFFDDVMVNAEDEKIRLNRLNLLARLRALFLKVADIAYLQKI